MPIIKDYRTLICRTSGEKAFRKQTAVIMTYISKEEEARLDKGRAFNITRGNLKFSIGHGNVFCYGNIDFHTGSDDYYQVADLLPDAEIVHLPIHYDLDEHVCRSPIKMYQTCESRDVSKIAQYAYGVLGKPERVVIFKDER